MTRVAPIRSQPISERSAARWADKAAALAAPLVALAGVAADPAPVVARCATDSTAWPYGRFMLTWLDGALTPRVVHHLPDAGFFLDVLAQAFEPVFAEATHLRPILAGTTRTEMAITNDVLQIQLKGLTPETGYSMVRHHALMLFQAAVWLEEPARSAWLEFYDTALTHLDERPQGRPGLDELAATEQTAFADSVALAAASADEASAAALLVDTERLGAFLDYQLYAAAAIGLLWREYRATPAPLRLDWHRRQMEHDYLSTDYLTRRWTQRS